MSLPKRASDTESGQEKEPENIYWDQADRAHLLSLPEVKRQQIINQRREKFYQAQAARRVAQLTQQRRRPVKQSYSSDQQQDFPKKRRRKKQDKDYEPRKKRSIVAQQPIQYDHKREAAEISLQDLQKIRISRDQLAKWSQHLYFDKTVKGAFVRINIGNSRSTGNNIYLMCEIKEVKTQQSLYEIKDKKVKTSKLLVVAHGKTKRTMKMDIVSNTPFTHEQFEAYRRRLQKDGMKLVTHHHIATKVREIQQASEYKYTSEQIDKLLFMKLEDGLKRGKLGASAALELEKLKSKLEELKATEQEFDPQLADYQEFRKKKSELQKLIRKVERCIQSDDKVVQNSMLQKLNQRMLTRQQETDYQRAEEKRKQKIYVPEEIEEKVQNEVPSKFYVALSPYQLIRTSIENLLKLHSEDFEIDQAVEASIRQKTNQIEFPKLVPTYPGWVPINQTTRDPNMPPKPKRFRLPLIKKDNLLKKKFVGRRFQGQQSELEDGEKISPRLLLKKSTRNYTEIPYRVSRSHTPTILSQLPSFSKLRQSVNSKYEKTPPPVRYSKIKKEILKPIKMKNYPSFISKKNQDTAYLKSLNQEHQRRLQNIIQNTIAEYGLQKIEIDDRYLFQKRFNAFDKFFGPSGHDEEALLNYVVKQIGP